MHAPTYQPTLAWVSLSLFYSQSRLHAQSTLWKVHFSCVCSFRRRRRGLAVHNALQTAQVLLHQRVVPYTGQWPQRRPQYTGNSPSTTMALASTAIARPTVVATTILACNAAQNWNSSLQSTGRVIEYPPEKSLETSAERFTNGEVGWDIHVQWIILPSKCWCTLYIVMPTSELRYN